MPTLVSSPLPRNGTDAEGSPVRRTHRVLTIRWQPRSAHDREVWRAARLEAGRVWSDLVVYHTRIRRLGWKWPNEWRWRQFVTKERYPGLCSAARQELIGEFLEALRGIRRLRANQQARGEEVTAAYPTRRQRYRDVPYTYAAARVRTGVLYLPNGTSGTLEIRLPDEGRLPGDLKEVQLGYDEVRVICALPDRRPETPASVVGVDLNVNSLLAATDGDRAIVVSGRQLKSLVQYRNQRVSTLVERQAALTKGSTRWQRLQRRKRWLLAKNRRQVRDVLHKATRLVAKTFPDAQFVVGTPFNQGARKMGPIQAQQVSQASNRKLIEQLQYKGHSVREVEEPYTSQQCPRCGHRKEVRRRFYTCPACGLHEQTDVLAAANIRSIGMTGGMHKETKMPMTVTYRRPLVGRRRSGGRPASSAARTSGREPRAAGVPLSG